jgi:hypothetical protein
MHNIIIEGKTIGVYMKIINSTAAKDKKMNLITYSFNVNNERFTANYFYGKKPKFEFFHNDTLIGSSDQIKNKSEFVINTEYESLNITVWLEYNVYSMYMGKLNGIGIEVNKNPVQHTLADPEVYINNGRSGFFILMFILGVKSIYTYYQTFKEYDSHIVSLIASAIYFIPLLAALFFTYFYKRWTKLALIGGIIISVLEFVDYGFALPASLKAGSNAAWILFWIALRVCVLFIFYNAFLAKTRSNAMKKQEGLQ